MVAVSLNPQPGGFGSAELQKLANELAATVVLLGLIGFLVGAGVKIFGGGAGNQMMSDKGGTWMSRALVAVGLTAAAAAIINFVVLVGGNVH
jgi:hypothetical protein